MVHWRRKWQTTAVFKPEGHYEYYEKAKRYDTKREGWKVSNTLQRKSGGQLLKAPERMKWLGKAEMSLSC